MTDTDPQQSGPNRSLRQRILSSLPLLTHAEQVTVHKQMRNNARADVDFFSMILLSASIADIDFAQLQPGLFQCS